MKKTSFEGGWSFPAGNNPNAQGMIWTGALPPTKAQWKTLHDKLGEDAKVDERSLVGKFDANYMGRKDWRGNEFYILQELYKAGIAGTDPEVTHHYTDKKIWREHEGVVKKDYVPGGVYHRWTDKDDLDNYKIYAGDVEGHTDYFLNADGIAVRNRRVKSEPVLKENRKAKPSKKPAPPKAKVKSVDQAIEAGMDKELVQGIAASLALSAVLGVVMWVLLF
jgi:hypothetical protein